MKITERVARFGSLSSDAQRAEDAFVASQEQVCLEGDIHREPFESEPAYAHRLRAISTDCVRRVLAGLGKPEGVSDAYWHMTAAQVRNIAPAGRDSWSE